MKKYINFRTLGIIIGGVLLIAIAGLAIFTQGEIFQGRLIYAPDTPQVTITRVSPNSKEVEAGSKNIQLFGLQFNANRNMTLNSIKFQGYIDGNSSGPFQTLYATDDGGAQINQLVSQLTLYSGGKAISPTVGQMSMEGNKMYVEFTNLNIQLLANQNITIRLRGDVGTLVQQFGIFPDRVKFGVPNKSFINITARNELVTPENMTFNNGVINGRAQDKGGAIITIYKSTSDDANPPVEYQHYDAQDFSFEGGTTDITVDVGSKIRISDDINIRIESIEPTTVRFSIWGRRGGNECSLISSTGYLMIGEKGRDFREFTGSFLELLEINNGQAKIRQYYGKKARERCNEIGDWKAPLACNFYPDDNYAFITNGNFKIHFYKDQNQAAADYFLQAFQNCRDLMVAKLPSLQNIEPFDRTWKIYPVDEPATFSTDYERISVPKSLFERTNEELLRFQKEILNNQCTYLEFAIPHELTHISFSTTPLQGVYDLASKNEFINGYYNPGIASQEEGLAEFIPYYISKDQTYKDQTYSEYTDYLGSYGSYRSQVCGKNKLLKENMSTYYQTASDEQMTYSEILHGRGFGANHYEAGFCFYKRIEDDCGTSAIDNLINQGLTYEGSIAEHPSLFKSLVNYCGEDKISEIMTDFGFEMELIDQTQKHPNTGFQSGLNEMGCME